MSQSPYGMPCTRKVRHHHIRQNAKGIDLATNAINFNLRLVVRMDHNYGILETMSPCDPLLIMKRWARRTAGEWKVECGPISMMFEVLPALVKS